MEVENKEMQPYHETIRFLHHYIHCFSAESISIYDAVFEAGGKISSLEKINF